MSGTSCRTRRTGTSRRESTPITGPPRTGTSKSPRIASTERPGAQAPGLFIFRPARGAPLALLEPVRKQAVPRLGVLGNLPGRTEHRPPLAGPLAFVQRLVGPDVQ